MLAPVVSWEIDRRELTTAPDLASKAFEIDFGTHELIQGGKNCDLRG